jgi:hypothetical protein
MRLSDEQVEVLDRALELAWHRFSQSDMDQHNLAEAQISERDPWKLAREELFHLWEVKLTGDP